MTSSYVNGVTTTYAYRGDGLRRSKSTNGVTTNHVWDGDQIVQDLNGIDLVREYVRGIRLIDTYSPASPERIAYIQNARGDVVGHVNDLTTVIDFVDYDAFGNLDTGVLSAPLAYCGEYLDSETGFIYLRARYYDPNLGRFTTEDPARDGLNWYVYCNNNPVNYVDPWGLAVWLIHGTNLNNDPNPQNTWSDDFRTYIGKQFDGETVLEGNWSGGNSDSSRKEGANKIYLEIKEYMKAHPDEPIRLIGHSHGGNVAILVTNMLAKDGYDVRNLITIATPMREYGLDKDVSVGQHVNVYNTKDQVQIHGGSIWLLAFAGRRFSDATNIDVTDQLPKEKHGLIASHSAMHSNVTIWQSRIWEKIIK